MLRWRLLLGVGLIGVLAWLCWLDGQAEIPGTYLLPLALVCAVLAAGEVLWLLAAQNLAPLRWLVYLGSFAIVASNAVPQFLPEIAARIPLGRLGWPLATLAIFTLVAFLGEMRRYERPGGVMVRLALGLFGIVYVGMLFTFVVQLRMFGSSMAGMIALVSLIAVVKMCDTGAYTLGRLIGKHKMAPVLSPGKTFEGAVGGVLFAVLGAGLVFGVWAPRITEIATPVWGWAAYGVLVGLAGMFGDLAESLFKRDMGRKDSSGWMPGFGGVLDVLDSILFAAPVAYLCWVAGLVRA